jgi:PPOX class probable F420-dependent enzyme
MVEEGVEIPEDRVEQLLARWPVARLATLAPGARPHQVPIVFARVGGVIWSSIDGKPKRSETPARVENIRRNPNVGVLLDHYDADWTRLWWLRVDGVARIVEGEGDETRAAFSALRAKYLQYAHTPISAAEAQLLRIEASAVRSWYAGPLLPELP